MAHPAVNMIHFTGSSAVGREIAIQAAGDFKRVSLELGGNNAYVVLDDADVDRPSMIGAWSAFHYSGQTCITAGRHIVARDLFDDYVERMAARAAAIAVGDPNSAEVGLGPMISEAQLDRGHDLLEDSVAMGAGGRGRHLRRALLPADRGRRRDHRTCRSGARRSSRRWRRCSRWMTTRRRSRSSTTRPTGSSTRSHRLARAWARVRRGSALRDGARERLDRLDEAHVPFGGIGHSGLGGRSGGEANLEEFTERRWIGCSGRRSSTRTEMAEETAPGPDLLVAGGGVAGMAAPAAHAARRARVLVVEKYERLGGSGALSAGILWTAPDLAHLRTGLLRGRPRARPGAGGGLRRGGRAGRRGRRRGSRALERPDGLRRRRAHRHPRGFWSAGPPMR